VRKTLDTTRRRWGARYILRKSEKEAAREQDRLEDKLEKLEGKIATRNEQLKHKPRSQPQAGYRQRHKLTTLAQLQLDRLSFGAGGLPRRDHRRFEAKYECTGSARQLQTRQAPCRSNSKAKATSPTASKVKEPGSGVGTFTVCTVRSMFSRLS